MFTINVRSNVKQTVDYLNRIGRSMGDQVLTRSLNDVVTQSRRHMIDAISNEFAISKADVRERLRIRRASRKGQRFEATLIGNPHGRAKRGLNVRRFIARKDTLRAWKKQAGGSRVELLFRIKRAGGLKRIKGAFVLNVAGQPVVERIGKGRGALKGVTTIGVPSMFQTRRVQEPVQRWIEANFPRIFDRHMRYFPEHREMNDTPTRDGEPLAPVIYNAVMRA